MHLSVALEKATLRRMSLDHTRPAVGFPRSYWGIIGLLDAIGLDAVEELVAIEEDRFIAAGRDLDTALSSSF